MWLYLCCLYVCVFVCKEYGLCKVSVCVQGDRVSVQGCGAGMCGSVFAQSDRTSHSDLRRKSLHVFQHKRTEITCGREEGKLA